jgi:type VI secretion system protein VasD
MLERSKVLRRLQCKPVKRPRVATSYWHRFLILFTGLSITGCSTVVQVATEKVTEMALTSVGIKVPENPAIPRPPKIITLRMEGAQDLNAGDDGQGLNTVMRLYKLRDQNSFLATPYSSFGITEKEKQMIDTDLVEVKELMLSPGQTLDLKEKMPTDAAYLGVVALFRSPHAQRWRFAFAASDAERLGITIGVHTCAMTATNTPPVGLHPNDAALLSSVRCK